MAAGKVRFRHGSPLSVESPNLLTYASVLKLYKASETI